MPAEDLLEIQANIDDMNPQIFEHVIERLLKAGALDATITPLQMKKTRPASLLSVLCRAELLSPLSAIVFSETTSLGLRWHEVKRCCLPRSIETVPTSFGPIRVKIAVVGEVKRIAPEFEDCRAAAVQNNLPVCEVIETVRSVAQQLFCRETK